MKKLSNKEIFIKYLLTEFDKSTSNKIAISQADLSMIPISEKDIIKLIYILKEDGLLTIVRKPESDDFSIYWVVALKSECIDYFKNKKELESENRNKWIQFLIPVFISIAALVVSIIAIA